MALLLAVLSVSSAPASQAAPEVTFSGVAAASAIEIEVSSPSLPLAQSIVTSFPSAQAILDSIGQSRGYAAAPYPGDTVLSLPGLVATLGLAYVPPYPLIAQTESPTTTEDSVNQGPLELKARSNASESHASATTRPGSDLVQFVARADVTKDTASGVVTVDADSRFDGLKLNDTLKLGSVSSHASAVLNENGEVTLDQSTTIDALVIAGQRIGLGPGGFELIGTTLPLPLDLNQLLAGTGLSVAFVGPQVDPDGKGIVAAGLEVTQIIEGLMPTPVTVRMTFGRARARLVGTPVPAVDFGSFPLPSPTSALPEVTSSPAPAKATPVDAAPISLTPTPVSPLPRPAPASTSAGLIAEVIQFNVAGLYLVLAIVGAVTAGAGRLFRYVGVDEP